MPQPIPYPDPSYIVLERPDDDTAEYILAHRRILATAKHKFARFGYEGTTFSELARGADLKTNELSLHFDNKLDILMAVFSQGWAGINERMTDVLLTASSGREAAFSMLALLVYILERDGDLARLLLFESRHPHPESGEIHLPDGYRKFEELCAEVATRGQRDGSFTINLNPMVIACMLTGAAESIMRHQLICEESHDVAPFTPIEIVTAFDAMVSYLRPREL